MMSANSLSDLSDEIIWSLDANDQQGFTEALHRLSRATPQASPADVQEAVGRLTQVLTGVSFWRGADLAKVTGTMADYCPDITGLLSVLVRRVTTVVELSARFAATFGGDDLPDPEDPALFQPTVARLHDLLSRPGQDMLRGILDLPGQPEARAQALAEAWFTCNAWAAPMVYLSQRRDVRAMLPDRNRLAAATEAVRMHVAAVNWLHGLLLVLDGEVLLVLHRKPVLGYRVKIGGIGDNAQLQTLLAASLIGKKSRGLIPGKGPSPAEVAAASDGPDLTPPGGFRGYFSMTDAFGDRIGNEGRPVDIARLEGTRVIVLDPAAAAQAWSAGRAYPRMRPTVEVTESLGPHAASYWLSKVKLPAR